jgi:transcriptional regulator with XRE-family HTH domain
MREDRDAAFYARVGTLLAAMREERGMSQEALAVQLQRDQSYVSRIESAGRHASLVYLLEWADALNVPFGVVADRVSELWRSSPA